MNPFRRSTTAALSSTREALAAAEAQQADLHQQRETALLASDDVAGIEALDGKIAAQARAVQIHKDRISALERKFSVEERARREREKVTAIAVIERRIAERCEKAKALEASITAMAAAWFALEGSSVTVFADWPAALPWPSQGRLAMLRADGLRKEFAAALFSAGRPAWNRPCAIPAPASPPAVAGLQAGGLSDSVAASGEVLLAHLRAAPPRDELDQEAA